MTRKKEGCGPLFLWQKIGRDAQRLLLAALLGQMETERAAVTACAVHAGAGDVCAQKLGEYGMTPSDIIEELPYIFKTITE